MASRSSSFLATRPYIYSILLVVLVVAWMLSGQLSDETQMPEPEPKAEHAPVRVQVKDYQAEVIENSLNLYGRTDAKRDSVISAEVSGRLVEFMVEPGRKVNKGQALARLDVQDRQAQLQRAQALLEQRQIQYEGVKSLNKKGFQGKASLAEARAALVDAEAMVKNLNLAIDNTQILAPYAGIFNDNFVDAGAFLGIGDPILQLSDISRLVVRVDISGRDIGLIKLGDQAEVRLVTGEELSGKVNYIAAISDPNTLTYKVEVVIDNRDGLYKAGLSAQVRIPLQELEAIKVSPAVLALDDNGELGVKTVVDNVVQFTPARLVRSEPDGAWLSGFSGNTSVIILGQGFVRAGDTVEPVYTTSELLPEEVK